MSAVKRLLLSSLLLPGFPASLKYVQRRCATVFMLHRFQDAERGIAGCDVSHLRRALAYLVKNNYEFVSLTDLFDRLAGKGPQPSGAVAFTIIIVLYQIGQRSAQMRYIAACNTALRVLKA